MKRILPLFAIIVLLFSCTAHAETRIVTDSEGTHIITDSYEEFWEYMYGDEEDTEEDNYTDPGYSSEELEGGEAVIEYYEQEDNDDGITYASIFLSLGRTFLIFGVICVIGIIIIYILHRKGRV